MSDRDRDRLGTALPSASKLIVEALVPELWRSTYRDDFLKLFLEAYRAYLGGCPRASILVAGESLLRAVFARIESEVLQRGAPLMVQGRGGRTKSVGTDFEVEELPEYLTFCEALDLLKQNRVLPEPALDVAYTVKDLRNHAAHGQFPLLDQWDPDEPRLLGSPEHEKILWDKSFVFPEGYRFVPSKKRGTWFTFDCRSYSCKSFKGLGVEEQYAAIQYCLVVDALLRMFKETIRVGDRVRKRAAAREGTVVESDGFSVVYRAVKWDDGEVNDRVRISDIEKIR
jgi:hypothetical protein